MKKAVLFLVGMIFCSALAAQSNLPSVADLDDGWTAIPTGGLCSAGTPYQFYANPSASSDNLLIYFNGGGACWFGQACDLNSQPNVHSPFADMDANNPALGHGIFAEDATDNPFRDYDMVFLPYCTGDVFVGAGERFYSYTNAEGGEVTINTYHNGYLNSTTVLDWIYQNFDAPERVVIGGSSAGAIGSSFYAGFVAEHYADTPVVLIADAAGGYNSPDLPNTFNAWDTAAILPDWPDYAGKTNDTLTFEDFYIASARHSPNLTIAQYNAAEDAVQYNFSYLIGDPPGSFSLAQRILNHYVEIESAVDSLHSYTAGGTVHTILRSPLFYSYEVEGVRFVDWVDDLINGRPVRDISCVNEADGCAMAPDE
ncbi:MAG: pectin acetylesterase-family hydrolase [Gammaproteobacteria bacterium]